MEEFYLENISANSSMIQEKTFEIDQNTEEILEELKIVKQEIISGDNDIKNELVQVKTETSLVAIIAILFVIYYFIMRCLK